MGLFSFFRKNTESERVSGDDPYGLIEMQNNSKLADEQIKTLQAADRQFERDNNLENRISVYESVIDLKQKPLWNSFNYCMSLVKMYVKANRVDKAWNLLNEMSIVFNRLPAAESYLAKIRDQQHKILKKEKKFKDALQMLSLSHVLKTKTLSGSMFNEEKFIKDAKTIAKEIGLSESQLTDLALLMSKASQRANVQEGDIIEAYRAFINNNGL